MSVSRVSRRAPISIAGVMALFALVSFGASIQIANVGVSASARQSSSVTPATLAKPELVQRYQQMITPDRLASRLHFLASDLFEGRETTTRGQKLAAQYLSSQYRQLGLAPKGSPKEAGSYSPGSYFQPFPVYRRTPEKTQLEVSVNGNSVASSSFSAETSDDLSYFLSGDLRNSTGGVVFAGYGIADDSLSYNEYAALATKGISIDGKWLIILDDEPMSDSSTSLLPTKDYELSKWNQIPFKRKAAMMAGKPLGFLIVTETSPANTGTFRSAAALASRNARRVGALSLNQHSDAPTAFAISTKLANQLLKPSGQMVESLKEQINRSLKPNVFAINGANVKSTVESSKELESENVLAFIEGSDPVLKDEVLIISSHYDHLGLNPGLNGDQIFNGAADDGSGVVASLEIAQTLMAAKLDGFGPRRSILFVNFSGEEKGLLGSSYYAHRKPVVPLAQTVADINMDGVGGFDLKHPTSSKNYIYIVGAGELSKQLIEVNRKVNAVTGSTLELTDHDYFPSDQFNFQMELVPFIYYSSGLTEHYHQPNDEPQTIAYDHLARVTRLIFATAWQIANQDAKPTSVDRSKLTVVGYVCPPCAYECDAAVHSRPGECPVCGMDLVPKYAGPGVGGN
jgi:Zn-dependent M28 family amino/carboxypeptidase